MDEIQAPTTTGSTPEQTLLAVLKATGDLQGQPLVPQNNPLLQVGAALSGFAAGTQGRPNPVLHQLRQERADQISALHQQAAVAGTIATLQDRVAQRTLESQRERRLEERMKVDNALKMAEPFLKNADNPESVRFGLRLMRQIPGITIPEGAEEAMAATGNAKTLRERLDMTLAALDRGLEPTAMGVNVAGIDVARLRSLSKEDRLALMSPEAQTRLADAADKGVKARMDRIKLDATERIQAGTPQAFDYEITGVGAKTADQVVAKIVEKRLNGLTLSREEQGLFDQWRVSNQLKGLQGNAAIALGKALGIKGFDRAWEALKAEDKSLSEVELMVKAAEAQERMKQPGYIPTLQDRSYVGAANMLLERRDARPMPQKFTEQLDAARNVFEHLNAIEDIFARGGGKYVGPIAGRMGKAAEAIGFTAADRTALYQAINGLMLETGPDRFGSAFTATEKSILQAVLAEVQNPSSAFSVKIREFRKLAERKYRERIAQAKANKWRIADEYLEPPSRGGDTDALRNAVEAAKGAMLTGGAE
jgi:hypothetical protein